MADLIVDAKPMDTVSDESSDVQMTQTTEEGIISLPETVTFSESDLHLTPAPAPVATSTPVPVSVPVPVSTSVSTTTTTSNANGNQSSSAASQQTSAPAIKTKKKKGSCNCCGFAGELLSCQQCLEAFHLFCLDPPLQNFPAGSWTCRRCASANIPPFIPDGSNVLSNIIQGILTSNPEVYNIPPDLEPLPTSAIPPENRTLRKKKTNDAHCYACKQEKLLGDNDYVDCHRCSHSFHLYCLEPMLLSKPIGVWTCPSHPGGHSSANVVHNSYGYTNGHASSSSSSSSAHHHRDGRNTLQADNIVVDFFPYDQLPADDPNKANMPTNRRVKRPPSRTSNLADREKAEWLLGVARSFQEKNRARQKTSTAKDHLEQLLSMIAETANPLPEESVHQLRDIQHRLLAEALGETQVQTPQTLQTPALVQQSSAQASADPIANITPEGMSAFTPLFVQFLAWQRLMQINQTLKNYKVPLQPSSSSSSSTSSSSSSSSSTSSRPPISSSSSTIPLIGGAAAASGASLSAADPDDPSPVSKVRRRRKSKADTDDYNEDFSPKPKRPRTIDPTSDDDDLDATLEDIDYEKGDASAKKIARSALAGASTSPAGVLGAKKKKGRGRGRPRTSSSNDDLDDHEGPSPSPSPSPSPALAPPSLTSSFLFAPSLSSPSASLVAPTPSVIPPVSTAQVPQTDIKMAIATVTPSVPRTPLAASSILASSIAPILSNFSAAPVDPRAFVSAPPSAPAPRSSFGLRITDPSVHLNVTATTFPFKIGRCKVKEGEQPIDLNLAKYSEGGDTRKVSHLHCVFSVPEDAPPGHFAIHCKGRNGVVCNGQELRLDESRTLGPDPVILHVGPFVLNVEPLL